MPLRVHARWQDLIRHFGTTKGFGMLGRSLVGLDSVLQRRTNGRFSITGIVGQEPMLLTTIGRNTGQPRDVPLIFTRHGSGYVVIASNWGQNKHPGWSANLMANPDAVVVVSGERFKVKARLVTGTERLVLWQAARSNWPAYEAYEERAGRDFRVFLLEVAN